VQRFLIPLVVAVLACACSGEPADAPTPVAERAPDPAASPAPAVFATPPIEPAIEPPPATPAPAPSTAPAVPAAAPAPPPSRAPAPAPAPPASSTAPAESAALSAGRIPVSFLVGRIDPAKDPAFARIPATYVSGSRVWGHKDAVEALTRMADAAGRNGYKLRVVSAFRSFDDQKQIWEDKWTGKTLVEGKKLPRSTPDPKARALKILEFSAMPGTSRHHWGTDFDFNSLSNSYFRSGEGKRLYDWLTAHAAEYGFCQPYTAKGEARPDGYEEEKWHWSYMPVASWYLQQYPSDVGYERLTGFEGSAAAKDIDVIGKYVQGINPDCR
jgi:hypothetical protein